jgi:hypothetical protein
MKKSKILLVLLCLIAITSGYTVNAQEEKTAEFNTQKHQINIGFADIFAKTNWYSYWLIDEYGYPYFYYPYGFSERQTSLVLGYKNKGQKGAFRVGMNLRYFQDTQEDQDTTGYKYTYKHLGSALNLGYEWHSTFKRLNVYYGFDLSFSYINYVTKAEYSGYMATRSETYTRNELAVGINPLIGINYFITPKLSIGTEVKLTAEYTSGNSKWEETNNNPYSPDYNEEEVKRNGFRMYFGPLGFLSINIHL